MPHTAMPVLYQIQCLRQTGVTYGKAALQAVKGNLASVKGRLRPFRSVSLRLSTGDETVVAPALKRLSTQFEGSVGIGSYPVSPHHTEFLSSPVHLCASFTGFLSLSTSQKLSRHSGACKHCDPCPSILL